MKIKLLKNGVVIVAVLFLAFGYYQTTGNDEEIVQTDTEVNYQTIVLKDATDTLIPIEVDLGIQGEKDQLYRNMLYLMQSSEYENLGLYALLPSDLEVNAMEINENTLTFDFNDSLYMNSNEEALDIFEGLSYVFCQDEIDTIKLKVEGIDISYLPNSTIPTSCLTKNLGINNFDSDSLNIHRTVPVMVYNQKVVNDKTYYVPTTTRLEVSDTDINNQVSLLLDKINYQESVSLTDEASVEEGTLKVSLSSNVLLDNETMDNNLYQQIILSLNSISGVEEVCIYVDDQELTPTIDVSAQLNNRIKL